MCVAISTATKSCETDIAWLHRSIFSVLQPGIGLYYECIRLLRAKLNLYDVLSFYQVLQNGYM